MTLTQAIIKRIKDLCNLKNITPNKLADMAGMPAGLLKSIFMVKVKIQERELCWKFVRH